MIRRLRLKFHLAQSPVRVSGRFSDRLFKQFRVHKVRARAGDEIASVPDQLHASQVDLPVAARSRLNGIARFGKRRGIEDDNIVLFSL